VKNITDTLHCDIVIFFKKKIPEGVAGPNPFFLCSGEKEFECPMDFIF
jgi:hypothetical protein